MGVLVGKKQSKTIHLPSFSSFSFQCFVSERCALLLIRDYFCTMLTVDSWLDPHPWTISKEDLKSIGDYESIARRQKDQLNENDIKTIVSGHMRETLTDQMYSPDVGIELSEEIAQKIRKELADKYNHT
jgi:hypothetical protein